MKITRAQKIELKKVSEKYNIKLMLVFGSVATGNDRADSDMDIGILFEKEIDFSGHLRVQGELQNIFQKKIDIAILNHANPLLMSEVSKNPILLYGDKKELLKFRLYSFHRYNDYAPFFEMEKRVNSAILKKYDSK